MATKKKVVRKVTKKAAFWLVWKDAYYDRVPNHRHATYEDARAEAERLAIQFPSSRFYVLAADEYAHAFVSPVEWKSAADEPKPTPYVEEPPF